jgi:hypothetical protein
MFKLGYGSRQELLPLCNICYCYRWCMQCTLLLLLLLLLLPLRVCPHQASTTASILQMTHQKTPWTPVASFLCLLRERDTCKRSELRELRAFAVAVSSSSSVLVDRLYQLKATHHDCKKSPNADRWYV